MTSTDIATHFTTDATDTLTTLDDPAESRRPDGHDWRRAGDAWGRRARDWACLFEHYATDAIIAIFDELGVGPGTSVLDIACGSGLALRFADAAGASTAGIDAAASLVEIATSRAPSGDIRLGDMFDLPWADESFDVVTSINGIWGGCRRPPAVLRPRARTRAEPAGARPTNR